MACDVRAMKKYDIVLADLGNARNAVKRGMRPCVVVHNNIGLSGGLGVALIAPLTTSTRPVPLSVLVRKSPTNGLKDDSRIHFAHLGAIDRAAIGKKLGILEPRYRDELREMIIETFDLFDNY